MKIRLYKQFLYGIVGVSVLLGANNASALTINIFNANPVPNQSFRLVSAMPADMQILNASPATVSLTFTLPLRMDRSSIKVLDMYGSRMDDGKLDANGTAISVSTLDLAPGKYTVKWQATCRCDDGQILSDSYHFIVQPQ